MLSQAEIGQKKNGDTCQYKFLVTFGLIDKIEAGYAGKNFTIVRKIALNLLKKNTGNESLY